MFPPEPSARSIWLISSNVTLAKGSQLISLSFSFRLLRIAIFSWFTSFKVLFVEVFFARSSASCWSMIKLSFRFSPKSKSLVSYLLSAFIFLSASFMYFSYLAFPRDPASCSSSSSGGVSLNMVLIRAREDTSSFCTASLMISFFSVRALSSNFSKPERVSLTLPSFLSSSVTYCFFSSSCFLICCRLFSSSILYSCFLSNSRVYPARVCWFWLFFCILFLKSVLCFSSTLLIACTSKSDLNPCFIFSFRFATF